MKQLASAKSKINIGHYNYRGFEIKGKKKKWEIVRTPFEFSKYKGLLREGLKKVCLELDSSLGEILKEVKPTKKKDKSILELNLDNLFYEKSLEGRSGNSKYNRAREKYIYNWIKGNFIENTKKEYSTRNLLMKAFQKIGIEDILDIKEIGGRKNCDFEILFIDKNSNIVSKFIEFKSTQTKGVTKNTLFAKTTKETNFFGENDKNYSKLFFNEYLPKILDHYNIKKTIDFKEYLKYVYQSISAKDSKSDFIRTLDKHQLKDNGYYKKSYCNYLTRVCTDRFLKENMKNINIENIETVLNDVLHKKKDYWLIWNQISKSFHISKSQKIKIDSYELKKGENDLYTMVKLKCYVLNNGVKEFKTISMRLAWNNHQGVLNPSFKFF